MASIRDLKKEMGYGMQDLYDTCSMVYSVVDEEVAKKVEELCHTALDELSGLYEKVGKQDKTLDAKGVKRYYRELRESFTKVYSERTEELVNLLNSEIGTEK